MALEKQPANLPDPWKAYKRGIPRDGASALRYNPFNTTFEPAKGQVVCPINEQGTAMIKAVETVVLNTESSSAPFLSFLEATSTVSSLRAVKYQVDVVHVYEQPSQEGTILREEREPLLLTSGIHSFEALKRGREAFEALGKLQTQLGESNTPPDFGALGEAAQPPENPVVRVTKALLQVIKKKETDETMRTYQNKAKEFLRHAENSQKEERRKLIEEYFADRNIEEPDDLQQMAAEFFAETALKTKISSLVGKEITDSAEMAVEVVLASIKDPEGFKEREKEQIQREEEFDLLLQTAETGELSEEDRQAANDAEAMHRVGKETVTRLEAMLRDVADSSHPDDGKDTPPGISQDET